MKADSKLVQSANVYYTATPSVQNAVSKPHAEMLTSELHSWKARCSTLSTLDGIDTLVKLPHSQNACPPISAMLLGMSAC